MLNIYEIRFGNDLVTETHSIDNAKFKAKRLVNDVIEFSIGENKDDYKLIQIHKYSWFSKITNFFAKIFLSEREKLLFVPSYKIFVWSELKKDFIKLK